MFLHREAHTQQAVSSSHMFTWPESRMLSTSGYGSLSKEASKVTGHHKQYFDARHFCLAQPVPDAPHVPAQRPWRCVPNATPGAFLDQ